jgi:hypothetical protein
MLLCSVIVQISSFIKSPRIKLNFNLYKTLDDDENDINNMDINLIEETVLDQSIEKAVKQMLNDGPKQEELSPTQKFKLLYEVSNVFYFI